MAGSQRTAQLLNLARVQLLTDPRVPLYLLGVELPFRQESNLAGPPCQRSGLKHSVGGTALRIYQMCRVVDVAVGPELVLDVLVAQDAHLLRQVLAVGAEEAPVQRYWRKQGEGLGPEAVAAAGRGC